MKSTLSELEFILDAYLHNQKLCFANCVFCEDIKQLKNQMKIGNKRVRKIARKRLYKIYC